MRKWRQIETLQWVLCFFNYSNDPSVSTRNYATILSLSVLRIAFPVVVQILIQFLSGKFLMLFTDIALHDSI